MTGALDICVCGDYRHQHKDGGRCTVCPVSPQPYPDCERFRLAGQSYVPRPGELDACRLEVNR